MKFLAPLLFLLVSLPIKAADGLTFFTDFDTLRKAKPDARVAIMFFSQPECSYCELVRSEFLIPLQQQHRPELIIRELKTPGFDDVYDRNSMLMTPAAFAKSYGIKFFPSVLMLDLDGKALGDPLVGISSTDFYGYYLDQAIEQALIQHLP